MSTEPADGWEYALRHKFSSGLVRVGRVLSSEAHADMAARGLRRIWRELGRPAAVVVVRRRPGGQWEIRPQDRFCHAQLHPLLLIRAARQRGRHQPRRSRDQKPPALTATERFHLYLRQLRLRLRLRKVRETDNAINELLAEIERDPQKAQEELRSRYPPAP